LKDDFKALCVYGKSSIADNVQKLQAGIDILVATPGRLNDLV
jgi:superfamily II DNA/RNA helicase